MGETFCNKCGGVVSPLRYVIGKCLCMSTKDKRIDDLEAENAKLVGRLAQWGESVDRTRPLCPDHRDKQAGKSCLVCEVEQERGAAYNAEQGFERAQADRRALVDKMAVAVQMAKSYMRSGRIDDAASVLDALLEAHDG